MNILKGSAIVLMAILVGCASQVHTQTSTTLPTTLPGLAAGVHFAGGDGSSQEKAVIVLGANEMTGITAEYRWLQNQYPGYKRGDQALLNGKDGKAYDVLEFTTQDGVKHTIYFDISDYFGKF